MSAAATATPCVLLAEEVWGSTLQAMRALHRAGVPVLVATAGEGAAVYGRSRACTEAIDVDPTDPVEFCRAVLGWIDRRVPTGQIVPVIPLSDRLVEYLDGSRELFEGRAALSIPPPELAATLLDKGASLALAARAGLEVPAWVTIADRTDLDSVASLQAPIALRPTSWATAGTQYFKIAVAETAEQAERLAAEALARGATLLAQEYIRAGDDDVVFSITWSARDRRPAIVTGRKRRQSNPDGGVMVWGQAELLDDVRAASAAFLDESGYEGLGGLEFIRSGEHLWFIEFNPRLEAIHFLATAAGVDTVLMEYRRLTGGEAPPNRAQRPATAWVGSAWLARVQADPSDWRGALGDRLEFARSPHRVRAVMCARDPLPAAAVAQRLISRGLAARRPGGSS